MYTETQVFLRHSRARFEIFPFKNAHPQGRKTLAAEAAAAAKATETRERREEREAVV